MKQAFFAGRTDVEIGDRVKTHIINGVFIIYDIRTIYQLRSNSMYFEFKLINEKGSYIIDSWLPRTAFTYPI